VFGISLQKIAVFVVIIGALWVAMRLIRTLDRQRSDRVAKRGTALAETMKECPVCGTYVAPASARDCGRARCPYPA
jgi:hypothetical protein